MEVCLIYKHIAFLHGLEKWLNLNRNSSGGYGTRLGTQHDITMSPEGTGTDPTGFNSAACIVENALGPSSISWIEIMRSEPRAFASPSLVVPTEVSYHEKSTTKRVSWRR